MKHQLEQMCPRGGSKELSQVQLSTIMTNLLLKGFKTVEEEDVTDMWQLLSRTFVQSHNLVFTNSPVTFKI